MIDIIRIRTYLQVDFDAFVRYSSPLKLLNVLSSCEQKIIMRNVKGKKMELGGMLKKTDNPILAFFANVPSEFYRIYNPRLNI